MAFRYLVLTCSIRYYGVKAGRRTPVPGAWPHRPYDNNTQVVSRNKSGRTLFVALIKNQILINIPPEKCYHQKKYT